MILARWEMIQEFTIGVSPRTKVYGKLFTYGVPIVIGEASSLRDFILWQSCRRVGLEQAVGKLGRSGRQDPGWTEHDHRCLVCA